MLETADGWRYCRHRGGAGSVVVCCIQALWLFLPPSQQDTANHSIQVKLQGHIQIAAIDNGLAFPFKHPDSWRTCKLYYNTHLFMDLFCILIQIHFTGPGYQWQKRCSPKRYVILWCPIYRVLASSVVYKTSCLTYLV